jgi:biotin carboxyl carrier protein
LVERDGTISIGDHRYGLEPVGAGAWRVTSDQGASIAHVTCDDEGCWVHVDGRVRRVEIAPAGARARRRSAAADHVLSAPMPATVLAVLVAVGEAVKAGDPVLMLEAMKMELPVRAPKDGIVRALHCREGELVQPGVTLVEIA